MSIKNLYRMDELDVRKDNMLNQVIDKALEPPAGVAVKGGEDDDGDEGTVAGDDTQELNSRQSLRKILKTVEHMGGAKLDAVEAKLDAKLEAMRADMAAKLEAMQAQQEAMMKLVEALVPPSRGPSGAKASSSGNYEA